MAMHVMGMGWMRWGGNQEKKLFPCSFLLYRIALRYATRYSYNCYLSSTVLCNNNNSASFGRNKYTKFATKQFRNSHFGWRHPSRWTAKTSGHRQYWHKPCGWRYSQAQSWLSQDTHTRWVISVSDRYFSYVVGPDWQRISETTIGTNLQKAELRTNWGRSVYQWWGWDSNPYVSRIWVGV